MSLQDSLPQKWTVTLVPGDPLKKQDSGKWSSVEQLPGTGSQLNAQTRQKDSFVRFYPTHGFQISLWWLVVRCDKGPSNICSCALETIGP